MPKFQYREEPNKVFEVLPEGDYLLEVKSAEIEISNGRKTTGAEVLVLKLRSIEHGAEFKEKLIFHPSCDWKVDNFLNCFGFGLQKGSEVEIEPEACIGRKGWCKVIVETFERKSGGEGEANKVAVFYTDKEKFPRSLPPVTAGVPTGGEDPDWN